MAKHYVDKVLNLLFKEARSGLGPNGDFVFHQDSAPSQSKKMTLNWLWSESIIFVVPREWLPNSPNAAPCDYFLGGYLKDKLKDRYRRT